MNQSNQVYQLHFLQMNQLRGRNYLMHQVLLHTLLQISLYLKIFDPKMIFNFDNQILIFVVFLIGNQNYREYSFLEWTRPF